MPTLKYMKGTTNSQYLQIGQIGSIGCGIRLYPPNSVNPAGLKDHTYFQVRMRIAPLPGQHLDPEEVNEGGIVSLNTLKNMTLDQAWPELPREKKDDERHSMFFGVYIKGDYYSNPEEFSKNLHDGKFREFCAKLVDLMGDQAIVDSSDIRAFIASTLEPHLAKMIEAVEIKQEIVEDASNPNFHLSKFAKLGIDHKAPSQMEGAAESLESKIVQLKSKALSAPEEKPDADEDVPLNLAAAISNAGGDTDEDPDD